MNLLVSLRKLPTWGRGLTLLAIFLVPLRIQLVLTSSGKLPFLESWTTLYGTLTDLLLMIALIILGWAISAKKMRLKRVPIIEGVLLLWFVGTSLAYLAQGDGALFTGWWRIGEIAATYLLVLNFFSRPYWVLIALIIPMTIETILAMLQYALQQSVGFFMLGEPFIHPDTPGVAKILTDGGKMIRAYGTFPHPNVLGAFLVVSALGALHLLYSKKQRRYFILLMLLVIGLVVTFSRTGLLAAIAGLLTLAYLEKFHMREQTPKLHKGLIIILVSCGMLALIPLGRGLPALPLDQAFQERWNGIKMAVQIVREHPLGVGVSGFTNAIGAIAETRLFPWNYQPVHNIFLLQIAETGFFTGMFAIVLLGIIGIRLVMHRKTFTTRLAHHSGHLGLSAYIAMIILGSLDHLLWTDAQGRILFGLLLALFAFALQKGQKIQKLHDGSADGS